MPAQYMFKDIPTLPTDSDYVDYTISQMDQYGIVRAMVGYWEGSPGVQRAREHYPHRFLFDYHVNPNRGMDDVRAIRRLKAAGQIHAVSFFPCGNNPQVPINDKKVYPIYATCVDLDLPIFVNVGVPGPRLPMAPQHCELVDEVCWFFPELKFVMRHGAEPWEDLAVKLMLKWPNQRLRAASLSEGDHRLRQHARRRSHHLFRLLADGPVARAHLPRVARRALQRFRVA